MTELKKLSGNIALVTGASSGFGLAIANRLAAEGCDLHLADSNETDLEEALEEIGLDDDNEPVTHPTDLSEPINAAALALECEEINILINTLPAAPAGNIDDIDDTDWLQAFEETVLCAINMTREVYESLQEIGTGIIFNIGCSGLPVGEPESLAQDTINAALQAFSDSLDKEAAHHGVRVYFKIPSQNEDPADFAEEVVNQILGHQAS